MSKTIILVFIGALFVTCGFMTNDVTAQLTAEKAKYQAATITEEKSAITEEEAELKAEAATLEKQRAEVEEKKTNLAEEEDEIRKRAETLAEKEAALAQRKAEVAKKEADLNAKVVTLTSELEQKLADLQAKETERGILLTLGDVVFESGQANLRATAMENLYPMVTFLRDHPARHILIEGHTDNVGAESYNLNLSQERAAAVQTFLLRNGVSTERITARGYGEQYPVDTNATRDGRQKNRRVEIVLLREGKRVDEVMRNNGTE